MDKRVELTPLAAEDVEKIFEYGFEHFGWEKAEQYIEKLDELFHLLAESPGIGLHYGHVSEGLYMHPHQQHLIFFRKTLLGIRIIRVLGQSQDVESHLTLKLISYN